MVPLKISRSRIPINTDRSLTIPCIVFDVSAHHAPVSIHEIAQKLNRFNEVTQKNKVNHAVTQPYGSLFRGYLMIIKQSGGHQSHQYRILLSEKYCDNGGRMLVANSFLVGLYF